VNGLRCGILRQERAVAGVELDIDRIKTRLDLSDGRAEVGSGSSHAPSLAHFAAKALVARDVLSTRENPRSG
jgi:hypothetical protein